MEKSIGNVYMLNLQVQMNINSIVRKRKLRIKLRNHKCSLFRLGDPSRPNFDWHDEEPGSGFAIELHVL